MKVDSKTEFISLPLVFHMHLRFEMYEQAAVIIRL